MGRFLCILPIAFGLLLLPYATVALNVKSMPPTGAAQTQHFPNAQAHGPNPLIEKACANAPQKSLCVETLKAQPNSGTADLKTLAFMSLNVTKAYGSILADWVSQKLEDPELGPNIQQGLTDCADQYTDAMAQLEDSMVAFFSNAYKDINTWLSTAMSNANTCEEGLKEEEVGSVMDNKNQVFAQYCSNSLAVVNAAATQQ